MPKTLHSWQLYEKNHKTQPHADVDTSLPSLLQHITIITANSILVFQYITVICQ